MSEGVRGCEKFGNHCSSTSKRASALVILVSMSANLSSTASKAHLVSDTSLWTSAKCKHFGRSSTACRAGITGEVWLALKLVVALVLCCC